MYTSQQFEASAKLLYVLFPDSSDEQKHTIINCAITIARCFMLEPEASYKIFKGCNENDDSINPEVLKTLLRGLANNESLEDIALQLNNA